MKHTCPYCNERSISSWSKFNSSALHPAICPKCNGLSKQHYAGTVFEALLATFGVPAILLWSLLAKSWWPIIVLILVGGAVSILKFVYTPMVAVDLARAKNYHWFAFGCLVMVFIWAAFEALGG